MTRRVYNPNCKICKYRSGTPRINGCDYFYLTNKLRGCPVKGCKRFEEGEREKVDTGIVIDKVTEEDLIMSGYVTDTLRHKGCLQDRTRPVSMIAKK